MIVMLITALLFVIFLLLGAEELGGISVVQPEPLPGAETLPS